MAKISEHPAVVGITILAGIAAILSYFQQFWLPSLTATVMDHRSAKPFEPEWWIVDIQRRGGMVSGFFVDRNSIRQGETGKQAWALLVNSKPEADGTVEVRELVEYDCSNNKFRDIQSSTTFANAPSKAANYTDPFVDVVPGSTGSAILNFVCFGTRTQGHRVENNDPERAVRILAESDKTES